MEFTDRHGNTISNLTDWETLGKPAAEHHWVEGRSAYELAADWIEGDAQTRVTSLLEPGFPGIRLERGVAEKQTRFDAYQGGSRNHDLLVTADCEMGKIVIGVEGKADEPFDKSLWKKKLAAQAELERNERSRGLARLDELSSLLVGAPVDQITEDSEVGGLGYQLLTAFAGTLADAKLSDAVAAVVLVHEFVTDETEDAKHRENAANYENFLSAVGAVTAVESSSSAGWITPPLNFKGDGNFMPASLPVSFAKLVTNTRR